MTHVLVIGSGSVGRRHARNLAAMGVELSAVDPRADRLDQLATEVPLRVRAPTLDHALAQADAFSGVVVASPPAFHVEQACRAIELGLPVLLEKPVAPQLSAALELLEVQRRHGAPVLVGYTWRWWPPLQRMRDLVLSGAVGRPVHVRCVMSAHLADWHPWERYQDFFMASSALGGGALLDESHWIDVVLWLFGMPERASATVERLTDLEIDTDDNVDMVLFYGWQTGPRVTLHLDLFGRPHEKSVTVTGEDGTVQWTESPSQVRWARSTEGWQEETFDLDRNHMFEAEARHFLEVVGGSAPGCNLDDGVRVLQVVEAARRSQREARIAQVPTLLP